MNFVEIEAIENVNKLNIMQSVSIALAWKFYVSVHFVIFSGNSVWIYDLFSSFSRNNSWRVSIFFLFPCKKNIN